MTKNDKMTLLGATIAINKVTLSGSWLYSMTKINSVSAKEM